MKSLSVESAAEEIVSALGIEAKETLDSPEYGALNLMREACEHWQKGIKALEEWDGVSAEEQFGLCRSLANKARDEFPPTEGYYGPRIELRDASDTLASCMANAQRETARRVDYCTLMNESGAADLRNGKAASALSLFRRALEIGMTDIERADAEKQIDAATTQLRRQQDVKNLHDEAVEMLR